MENLESKRERSEYFKAHYLKNKAKKDAYAKEYRIKHIDKALAAARVSNKKNFQRTKLDRYKYRNERYKTVTEVRITELLRKRFKSLVYKGFKKESAIDLLGCSLDYFKSYIESKFYIGMSWENHGLKTWHIDHIKPCASFDLTKVENQKICFHYTNMQPLWAFDNLSKSDKIL